MRDSPFHSHAGARHVCWQRGDKPRAHLTPVATCCPAKELADAALAGDTAAAVDLYHWAAAQDEPRACTIAAAANCVPLLTWLCGQQPPFPWSADTKLTALVHGHLTAAEWLHSQLPPCPVRPEDILASAAAGRLEMLQLLIDQENPGMELLRLCSATAAAQGHAALVSWLRQHHAASFSLVVSRCVPNGISLMALLLALELQGKSTQMGCIPVPRSCQVW